jgi:ribosome modulation factor
MKEIKNILPDLKLRFHVEHPTLEECYAYGYESALANIAEDDNPYAPNSLECEQWLEGWWAGFYNDQPLFDAVAIEAAEEDAALLPANDVLYHAEQSHYLLRALEIAGVIAVSAILGYQVIDIVA